MNAEADAVENATRMYHFFHFHLFSCLIYIYICLFFIFVIS